MPDSHFVLFPSLVPLIDNTTVHTMVDMVSCFVWFNANVLNVGLLPSGPVASIKLETAIREALGIPDGHSVAVTVKPSKCGSDTDTVTDGCQLFVKTKPKPPNPPPEAGAGAAHHAPPTTTSSLYPEWMVWPPTVASLVKAEGRWEAGRNLRGQLKDVAPPCTADTCGDNAHSAATCPLSLYAEMCLPDPHRPPLKRGPPVSIPDRFSDFDYDVQQPTFVLASLHFPMDDKDRRPVFMASSPVSSARISESGDMFVFSPNWVANTSLHSPVDPDLCKVEWVHEDGEPVHVWRTQVLVGVQAGSVSNLTDPTPTFDHSVQMAWSHGSLLRRPRDRNPTHPVYAPVSCCVVESATDWERLFPGSGTAARIVVPHSVVLSAGGKCDMTSRPVPVSFPHLCEAAPPRGSCRDQTRPPAPPGGLYG